uniref:Uncharacterized protein n=1 Tax=Panagrolaimus sp. ES5 TaxID=591445 RepID=A0AC34FSM2_9BILA
MLFRPVADKFCEDNKVCPPGTVCVTLDGYADPTFCVSKSFLGHDLKEEFIPTTPKTVTSAIFTTPPSTTTIPFEKADGSHTSLILLMIVIIILLILGLALTFMQYKKPPTTVFQSVNAPSSAEHPPARLLKEDRPTSTKRS